VINGTSVVFSGNSTNKTDSHDIGELLLKLASYTIALLLIKTKDIIY
jgi:hypothetical protein